MADPATLLVDTNIRVGVDLNKEFLASTAEHGVLVPIVARGGQGAFRNTNWYGLAMSPRFADTVPEDITTQLWRADARRRRAEEELKRLVRDAVNIASVRSVAGVLGMSPTTIQKWVHDDG